MENKTLDEVIDQVADATMRRRRGDVRSLMGPTSSSRVSGAGFGGVRKRRLRVSDLSPDAIRALAGARAKSRRLRRAVEVREQNAGSASD